MVIDADTALTVTEIKIDRGFLDELIVNYREALLQVKNPYVNGCMDNSRSEWHSNQSKAHNLAAILWATKSIVYISGMGIVVLCDYC